MIVRRMTILSVLVLGSVAVAPVSAGAAGLPDGYQNFVPEIDYDAVLSEATSVEGAITCTVTKAEGIAFPASLVVKEGAVLDLDSFQSNPTYAAQAAAILANPDSAVETTCPVAIALPGSRSFSGTVTNAALEAHLGTDTGTYALDCNMSGTVTATAKVALGGKVQNKFTMAVERAAQKIPLNCAVNISFSSSPVTTLTGSVAGEISVTATADAVACQGADDFTCVPISLDGATVNITNATGKLAGYVGSGTYSFTDLFTLKSVDEKIKAVKSAAGVLSTRSSAVRPSSVRAASAGAESMTLTLKKGAAKPVIVHPAPAAGATRAKIAKGQKLTIASTKGAACTLTAAVKTKSTTVATVKKVGSNGIWKPAFTAAAAKKIGAKSNSTVKFTASCKVGTKKVLSTKTVTYGG